MHFCEFAWLRSEYAYRNSKNMSSYYGFNIGEDRKYIISIIIMKYYTIEK